VFSTPEHWVIDDQLALNILLTDPSSLPVREVEGAPRTVWAANSTLRLHPLPALLFASGHVGFVQRLPERYGVRPYMVHATFQPYGGLGKRNRFREFGLWTLDPESYYQGRFLTYDNGVRREVEALAAAHAAAGRGRMADFHRHLLAMAWQLGALRDALALARCAHTHTHTHTHKNRAMRGRPPASSLFPLHLAHHLALHRPRRAAASPRARARRRYTSRAHPRLGVCPPPPLQGHRPHPGAAHPVVLVRPGPNPARHPELHHLGLRPAPALCLPR
jgi:hypothetical protein